MFKHCFAIDRVSFGVILGFVTYALSFLSSAVMANDETPTRYAAIAVHDFTGAAGYSYNYGDRAEAERAAIRRAGSGSRVVLSTTARYIAFAQAPLGGWGAASGDTAEKAKQRALQNARKHSLCPEIKICEYNGPRHEGGCLGSFWLLPLGLAAGFLAYLIRRLKPGGVHSVDLASASRVAS